MAAMMHETNLFGVGTQPESTLGTATASTTTKTASTAPYSSEGPTLPILESAGEHGIRVAAPAIAYQNSKMEVERPVGGQSRKRKREQEAAGPNPDLAPLQKPWNLLPPALLTSICTRLGEAFWTENCVPVVMTKNQNIRSGVNKLKTYLWGSEQMAGGKETEGALRSKSLVIAVSAMGDGSTKLVGVLEVLRRVVGRLDADEGDAKPEMWCMYTSLGSRVVEKKTKKRNQGTTETGVGDGTGAAMDLAPSSASRTPDEEEDGSFESATAIAETDNSRERAKAQRNVPILTVWLSKSPIPEFKTAFGEQEFPVVKTSDAL